MQTPFPDAVATVVALRERETTALAVTDACLARIAERDAEVGAWAYIDVDSARGQASRIDSDGNRWPLHGLPVGIKDVLLTKDMPTQYNCELYKGHLPQVDADCVALLRQAGAVILGKTETVELASIGAPPRTRNPHALDHTPGGSSSGSAAAVADGQVPIAFGTQTGGSIIRPASFCGTWGLKPTWGLVSTGGCKPFAPSLDTIGWFARSARDLALILDIFEPTTGDAPAIPDLGTMHIAVWRTGGWDRAETATRAAMDNAIKCLQDAGTRITELDLLAPFPGLADVQRVVMMAEGARSFLSEYRADPDKIHPRISEMVRSAGGYSLDDLLAAYNIATEARARFDDIAGAYDAVLAPSTIAEAPAGLASTGDLLFNGLFTLLHVPCVNMPLFSAANGLPVGLTLTGPRYSDHRIIAISHAISTICPD